MEDNNDSNMPNNIFPNNNRISPISPPDKKRKSKTAHFIKEALILYLICQGIGLFCCLAFAALVFFSCSGPSPQEFIDYLENKYGKNEDFSYIDNGRNCFLFNMSYCTLLFTSGKSNKIFKVRYEKTEHRTNEEFSDQYYRIKYDKKFQDYYYEKYGRVFEDIIPYNFSVFVDSDYYDSNERQTSFRQLIKAIKQYKSSTNYQSIINIGIDYKEVGLENIKNIDLKSLQQQTAELIQENKLQIDEKHEKIELVIDMIGSGYTMLCPNDFDAIIDNEDGYYVNINEQNKEITSCSATLYLYR